MGPITLRSDYASNMLTSLLVVMRPLPEIGIHTEKIGQLERDMKGVSYEDPLFANMSTLLIKHVCERRRLLNYLQISDYRRYRRAVALIESGEAA